MLLFHIHRYFYVWFAYDIFEIIGHMTSTPSLALCAWPQGCGRTIPPRVGPGKQPRYCGQDGHTAQAAAELRRRDKVKRAAEANRSVQDAAAALAGSLPPESRMRALVAAWMDAVGKAAAQAQVSADLLVEIHDAFGSWSDPENVSSRIGKAERERDAALQRAEDATQAERDAREAEAAAVDARAQAESAGDAARTAQAQAQAALAAAQAAHADAQQEWQQQMDQLQARLTEAEHTAQRAQQDAGTAQEQAAAAEDRSRQAEDRSMQWQGRADQAVHEAAEAREALARAQREIGRLTASSD